jgi:hypothetical protein
MSARETPRPGTHLPPDEARTWVRRFFMRFRKRREGVPRDLPTWCTFDDARRVSPDILAAPALERIRALLVLFENSREVYRASIGEIRDYFAAREPWEDYDIYLFDEELRFCIAFTHELIDGVNVLVVGELPEGS